MAEKKWLLILGIVNVLAVAGIVFWYVNRDHIPPVIMQEETIVYEETMSDSELLQGAVAMDETDGDVSHTLVVEKITVNHNTGIAMVTYGAMDSAGNIAKQSFRMAMTKSESPVGDSESDQSGDVFTLEAGEAANGNEVVDQMEEESEEAEAIDSENEDESAEEENAEDAADSEAEDEDDASEDAEDSEEEEADQENAQANQPASQNNQQQASAASEQPVLNFSAPEVKTKKGYNPAWVTVIGQLQDNKDTYEYLLQNLKISGEFTNATVGSYDVMVSTVDSDGNESTARAIRITVEE